MTAGVNYDRNNFKGSVCLNGYKINAHNGLEKLALVVQYREQKKVSFNNNFIKNLIVFQSCLILQTEVMYSTCTAYKNH